MTDLESYPSAYSIYLYTEDDSAPHHISEALEYFPQQIRLLTLPQLVRRLLRSLQGEAMSDAATLEEDNEEAAARSDGDGEAEWADWGGGAMGGVKENDSGFKGVRADKKLDFDILRRDFKEIFEAGFRPGFYRISDDEIVSPICFLWRARRVGLPALKLLSSSWCRSSPFPLYFEISTSPPKRSSDGTSDSTKLIRLRDSSFVPFSSRSRSLRN